MKLLLGKTALITGASRGIGRGIAIEMAKQGANIAFTYLSSPDKAATLETELAALGVKAKGYQSDASDFKAAEKKLIEFLKILNDTLRELPVGNISTHTPESIPERVGHWVREAAEECRLREQWEACADNLIHYAKDFAQYLEDGIYKNNPFSNHQNYQSASNAIEEYNRLKSHDG